MYRTRLCLSFLLLLAQVAIAFAHADTPASEYVARRAALVKRMGPDDILLLLSPPPSNRDGDVDWPFRQEDNLLYLTGIQEPETTLILVPGQSDLPELLLARPSKPQEEVWTGRVPTADALTAKSGVKVVVTDMDLNTVIESVLDTRDMQAKMSAGKVTVWVSMEKRNLGKTPSPELAFVEQLRRSYPDLQFHDAFPLIADMRKIKSPTEMTSLQRAIDVTVAAQKAGMLRAKTAQYEYQVQATIDFTFRDLGACCWAFPSIVAAGRNGTTLHYESDNDPIVKGGLLITDIGAEVDGYSADVTRTYPQNGTFTAEQRDIYEAVLRVQTATMAMMKPGTTMETLQKKATAMLGDELLKLGLISENTTEQVRLYFYHGLGHPIGLRTHDDGVGFKHPFMAGMVVTNEPGLYVRPDDVRASKTYQALPEAARARIDAALKKYADIAVRIEDDVLITQGEPKNLSAGAPRSIAEIEAWMRQ